MIFDHLISLISYSIGNGLYDVKKKILYDVYLYVIIENFLSTFLLNIFFLLNYYHSLNYNRTSFICGSIWEFVESDINPPI